MGRNFLIISLLIALFPAVVLGQSKITFNIDMNSQIMDSTFVPSKHSVELTGNQLPFSKTRTIKLQDKALIDSIYTATVYFPSIVNGEFLEYNFIIKTPNGKIKEDEVRLIQLEKQSETIPPAWFNMIGG